MTAEQLLARIAAGRTDLVHHALSELARDSAPRVEGASAIQWCAYYGDTSAVRALLVVVQRWGSWETISVWVVPRSTVIGSCASFFSKRGVMPIVPTRKRERRRCIPF